MVGETNGILWLIRSAGERTAQNCLRLVQEIAADGKVHFIEEEPFNRALVKGFEIAEASSAKWMVCIDADVLVHREGILKLLEVALTVDDDVCYVQGLTIDRFIPIIRSAGNGIYRTSIAALAKSLVPEGNATSRPETATMHGLMANGHKMYRTNIVVGIHDYEQYYRDIYRKVYLYTRKHLWIIEEAGRYWERMQENHPEFRVALAAMRIGGTYREEMPVSKSFKREEAQKVLFFLGLKERKALKGNGISSQEVADTVTNFRTHEAMQQQKFPQYSQNYFVPAPEPDKRSWLRKKSDYIIGYLAEVWGHRLTEWASD